LNWVSFKADLSVTLETATVACN